MSQQSSPLNERLEPVQLLDAVEAVQSISDANAETQKFFEEIRDRQRVDPSSLHERITL